MRKKEEIIEKDYEQIDRIIEEAKLWVQLRFMGIRATSEGYSHLQEIEKTNGYVNELRHRFHDDFDLIASYILNRESRDRESDLVRPEELSQGRKQRDNSIGEEAGCEVIDLRQAITRLRQTMARNEHIIREICHRHSDGFWAKHETAG